MDDKFKIIKTILIVGVVLLGITFVLKNIPFGEKKYYITEERYMNVPRFSFLEKNECTSDYKRWFDRGTYGEDYDSLCINKASFKSLSSKWILELSIPEMLDGYSKRLCNNSHYLYDNGEYITITDYGVEKGFLVNTYYVNYVIGEISNSDCLMIKDKEHVEFNYDYSYSPAKYDIDHVSYQYLNSDGKLYDVHSDCGDCLIITNGMGKGSDFKEMLRSNYIDMKTFIEALDIKAEKVEYDNGTMYKTDKITLFSCNTPGGNKDIYISDKFEYSDKFCNK